MRNGQLAYCIGTHVKPRDLEKSNWLVGTPIEDLQENVEGRHIGWEGGLVTHTGGLC